MKKLISFLIAIVFTNLLFKVNAQTNDIIFPKVSVIIPVYNTEKYLNDCLDCILGQSLIDTEIICVNDGSTDNSLEILNEYKDKDCRVKIINTENNGAAVARNIGLHVARGRYIAFVDSDDTIDLNAYEISYIKANEVDADILMFGEDKFSTKDKIYSDGFEALDESGSMMLWNKLYKRKFLIQNNFKIPEYAKCFHDECFNSVVFPKAECIRCIHNKFYHYRRKREGSIQTSASLKKKADHILIYADFVFNNWKKNNYVQNYSYWILKKVSFMMNRVFKKLNFEDKIYYCKKLKEILTFEVYNQKNIEKLSKYEKLLLDKWIKIV